MVKLCTPAKLVSVKKIFISNRLITRQAMSGMIANTNSTGMEGSINKYVQYLLLLGADMVEVVAGSDIHERGGFSGFYIFQ